MVKIHKPPAGGYASLHAKTWLCDGLVYLGGSCNFTRNSLTNNVENLVIVKSEQEAQSYLNWFEELWPSVREEIRSVMGVLFLIVADLGAFGRRTPGIQNDLEPT